MKLFITALADVIDLKVQIINKHWNNLRNRL